MLNTDLHNDNIPDEKKISFEQFVNMTRECNFSSMTVCRGLSRPVGARCVCPISDFV